MTSATFVEMVKTDQEAFQYLIENNILPPPPLCPTHKIPMHLYLQTVGRRRAVYRCHVSNCKTETAVLHNHLLKLFRLPPRKLLLLIIEWLNEHSISETRKTVHISNNTITRANIILRIGCYMSLMIKSKPIGGPNLVVEIDEAQLHRRRGHRGRLKKSGWVIGGYNEYLPGNLNLLSSR